MKRTSIRYTEEQVSYLKKINSEHNANEVINLFFDLYGIKLNKQQIYNFKKLHCNKNVCLLIKLNKEELNYIIKLAKKYNTRGSSKRIINDFFKKYNKQLSNSYLSNIRKKYGLSVVNWKLDERKETRGFIMTKVDNKWVRKHRLVLNNSEKNKCVIFKDGDKTNINKNNLRLITKEELGFLNMTGLYNASYDIKEVALNIRKLKEKMIEKKQQNLNL